jgi:hypothetical protein
MPYVFPYETVFELAVGGLIIVLLIVRIAAARRRKQAAANSPAERPDVRAGPDRGIRS